MILAVDVIAPVVVAVHVNPNGPVEVIRTVDETTATGAGQDRSGRSAFVLRFLALDV